LQVNALLNHQPWLITKEHVASLAKGEDSWSIGELVHAMLIICSFKALASVIFGCGVSPEIDFVEWFGQVEEHAVLAEEETKEVSGSIDENTLKMMELLKGGGGWCKDTEEQQEQLFVKAETMESNSETVQTMDLGRLLRFMGNIPSDLKHEDFDVKSKSYSIFRVQDYCWKEDGFELIRRFLPGAATLLDEEFDHIYLLTYNKFNMSANVDTFPFRRALWQYIQRVKGIFHDDYDYQEVNVFLNRATKSFIKKITCYPESITKSDFMNIGYQLTPDEKVHVALLAIESAKQSELLYGLHAVMKHMYNT